eukprot:CAMPEP_0194493324 /NCGR_PEP_ID=MMETSP0253-20130528/11580_1 /TAXON_ID=2966 /ORGANISM="Noctiluca scintillans" /LENGTH=96 /DNA_ID=CAMNT_0039334297 /DNA_START=218 /DNA_END=508 /DNA_ORIENTATION=-
MGITPIPWRPGASPQASSHSDQERDIAAAASLPLPWSLLRPASCTGHNSCRARRQSSERENASVLSDEERGGVRANEVDDPAHAPHTKRGPPHSLF